MNQTETTFPPLWYPSRRGNARLLMADGPESLFLYVNDSDPGGFWHTAEEALVNGCYPQDGLTLVFHEREVRP